METSTNTIVIHADFGATEDIRQTLRGVGPVVSIDVLESRLEAVEADVERERRSQTMLEIYDAQLARYEWFVERVEQLDTVENLWEMLTGRPQAPAARERALVELSLLNTHRAQTALAVWEPPADDPELSLFYQVCARRAR